MTKDLRALERGELPRRGSADRFDVNEVFAGGGEMGALMRSMDWASTPLGPPAEWPQSLRTTVSLLLNSRYPMFIFWGPKLVKIYNDGYRPILASKHPSALGRPGPDVWPEIWPQIGPMVATVVDKGEATWSEDLVVFMERKGFPEECYFTFSYSPVRDESGGVGGMFCACTETTEKVLGERRMRTLRDLAAPPGEASTVDEACRLSCEVLGKNVEDIPFALLYLLDREAGEARLVAASGTSSGEPVSPPLVGANDETAWPLVRVGDTRRAEMVSDLGSRHRVLPAGAWPEPPREALVLPLVAQGHDRAVGVLVLGVGSRRTFDESYRGFFSLVTNQVATSIAKVHALEEERRRAEALAEIDRAKTAFFSNVSHEFRTPLTLMMGPVEDGLADTAHPLPPAQRERQELVRRNGLRLQKLVNTLLDFACIEAGRAQVAFVETDLAALTADLASSFRSAIENAGLRLVVDCQDRPGAVYVDPSMWEKIVFNLLSNAFKFTFEGEIRVSLRSLGAEVELVVADTGTGIPPEELPHVFERFHRVEGARGRSHEGSGIGLALVRELVNLQGGGVEATSALGKGSTFRVRIPAVRDLAPSELSSASRRTLTPTGVGVNAFLSEVRQWEDAAGGTLAPTSSAAISASKARILVADDNADMRMYIARLLVPFWQVTTVNDGLQALASARAEPPDLILSDVMMPRMDGLTLVRELRADERTRTVPVVLLSARAGEEATVAGLAHGADAYLIKPFSAIELLARVSAQLSLSSLRQEALEKEHTHAEETEHLLVEARAATRSREDMVAVVTHDLRAPLAAIRTAAELIERARVQGEHAERVRNKAMIIERSVASMDRLIGDLLDISTIESGTLTIDAQSLGIDEIMTALRDTFTGAAEKKGIDLVVDVDEGVSRISADKDRIVQALSNLVGNALKFTPEHGSVRISVRPAADGVSFAVHDSGVGISADAMAHIFDRYWHSAQKGRAGHGLGLSIAKGIIDLHGGTLVAESEPGRGSTFSFTLLLRASAKASSSGRPMALAEPRPARPAARDLLEGEGEMRARIRSFDWSRTRLGALEGWPLSLRMSVATMLASPYASAVLWGNDLVLLYNDAAVPIFGEKHPTILGDPAHVAFDDVWELVGPLMRGVMSSGKACYVENGLLHFARQEGGLREEAYFTWSYIPVRNEESAVGGVLTVAAETTGHVIGARRLRTLRELSLRTAGDRTVGAVFRSIESVFADARSDVPFALVYVIKDHVAQLSACSGIARGTSLSPEKLSLDDPSPWPLAAVTRSGAKQLVERLHVIPDGVSPLEVSRALLLPVSTGADASSTAVLVVGQNPLLPFHDDHRSFLEHLARQISTSLASARAYEEEKHRAEELSELDRAKTAFFSNVSHELRTPLTLILGPVEDALQSATRTISGDRLDLVRRNALRLYKRVNALLDFTRIEAGRAQATFVPTQLAAFTADLASAFRSAVEGAGLELHVQCDRLPESIYVDPGMWESIVLNLLSNALKYTHRGGIEVRVSWKEEHAVLTVRDTGVGIPEEDIARVFERFHRARVMTGRSHEGTGIGLALVQELTRLHGGTVEVASQLGQGTTFTVRLPRGAAHRPSERVERTPRARSTAAGAAPFVEEARRWSPIDSVSAEDAHASAADRATSVHQVAPEVATARILFVDDNVDLREYVQGLLGRVFADVETAPDGVAALDIIGRRAPDLVVSDVMMPRLDGFGLVRALRQDDRTRAIPVILLSARAGDESSVEGLRTGADDYLVKPFSARELIARVTTQIEMARVRKASARQELEKEELRGTVVARDEFLSVASHELRTPLTALAIHLERLLKLTASARSRATNDEVTEKLTAALRQTDRLTRLIDALLDVSRIAMGRLELEYEDFDLAELCREVIGRFEDDARAVRASLKAELVSVEGRWDRARMEEALSSLVSNAIKFGPETRIDVRLESHGDDVRVTVHDAGAGIHSGDLERIFDRFERAVSAERHGGFGIGLYLARQIVEAHGGRLELQSSPGNGATFAIQLPRRSMPPRRGGPPSASTPEAG